jgi:hypothetical protein
MGCNASKFATVDVYEPSQQVTKQSDSSNAIRVVAPATPVFGGTAKSYAAVPGMKDTSNFSSQHVEARPLKSL